MNDTPAPTQNDRDRLTGELSAKGVNVRWLDDRHYIPHSRPAGAVVSQFERDCLDYVAKVHAILRG